MTRFVECPRSDGNSDSWEDDYADGDYWDDFNWNDDDDEESSLEEDNGRWKRALGMHGSWIWG